MFFVHPLLLGGLLLAGVPILVHLIMRQKPKHVMFPAFRFLLTRHRSNQRKLQLRHLLLLALRMLAIALICLALARPKLSHQGILPSADRPAAAVLLFDTSYSMGYTPAGGVSRLEEAKRRAEELLDSLPANSRVAVLDSAEPGGEWDPTMSMGRERLSALQLRPNNYPVTARFAALTSSSPKQTRTRKNPTKCWCRSFISFPTARRLAGIRLRPSRSKCCATRCQHRASPVCWSMWA